LPVPVVARPAIHPAAVVIQLQGDRGSQSGSDPAFQINLAAVAPLQVGTGAEQAVLDVKLASVGQGNGESRSVRIQCQAGARHAVGRGQDNGVVAFVVIDIDVTLALQLVQVIPRAARQVGGFTGRAVVDQGVVAASADEGVQACATDQDVVALATKGVSLS